MSEKAPIKVVDAHPLVVAERETGEAVKEMKDVLSETAAESIEHSKSMITAQEKMEQAIHRLAELNIRSEKWLIASVIINGLALLTGLITLFFMMLTRQ